MKLLLWHCASLAYTDKRAANRPAGIHSVPPSLGSSAAYEDVVLAFVTIERHDATESTAPAADAIARSVQQSVARNGCVLMPFAHLSRELAAPDRARMLLERLQRDVTARVPLVELASFGFHKQLELRFAALGHPGSVAFREF